MPFSFTIPFVAIRKPGAHSYHPVPAPEEETWSASPESDETHNQTFTRKFFFDPSFWLTAFAILSIAVTIRNLLVISREPRARSLEASVGSPYNGLERLVRNESSPLWPLSSTHYPNFVGATEGQFVHHALSNDSVVRLDAERTVIVQHRVHDYGLEYCAVKFELSRSTAKGHGHAKRGYGHIGERPYLTLWRLEEAALVSPSALPTPLPSRKEFLGDIVLDGMHSVQSHFFRCNMGSIQTWEIAMACASDPCIMEFRLRQSPRRQGFWVVQSEENPAP